MPQNKARPIPYSAEGLKIKFRYDAATGKLYNRFYLSPTAMGGSEAGSVVKAGYRKIKLEGQTYLAHRIIWKMLTGDDAPLNIWHINRDKDDNREENLILILPKKDLISGEVGIAEGITWDERTELWHLEILVGGTEVNMGYFKFYYNALSIQQAAEASLKLESAQFTEIKS